MIFGSGDFKYEVVEDWGTLPSGYELVQVAGVAVDSDDRVYAFNRSDHKMVVFESDGTFIKAWKETFNVPHGIRIGPDGNIYLADQGSHLVLKYAPDETLILSLGNPDQPSDTGKRGDGFLVEKPAGPFNQPTGVAVNSEGDIFVSDGYGNCRVHKFNSNGDLLMSWGVPGVEHPGEFHLPHGIGLDNQGRLFVADRENHRIQLYSQQGEHIDTWTGFNLPCSVTVGPDGTVYVPELGSRMSILDSEGNLLSRWGGEESKESGLFIAPHSAAVDSKGDLYIGEVLEGSRLQKFARV
ncbi:MAG: peptidyl-alpha-hydroxyglycine alpha-amidating lyase family protein [Chloroflexota bacterium]|nr:peptidyl-alpha-hydroxyglycine alpha-amidating lyase family protein [Chloroflexota bacterium]